MYHNRITILHNGYKMKEIPKILFRKKENNELEFEVFTLENLFSRSDKLNRFIETHHRVEFHHILYFTKGSGKHYVDFLPYAYVPGSILFVSKGQVHAFEVNQDREGFVILFTEAFLSKNLIHSDVLSLYRLYNYHLHSPIIRPEEIGKTRISNIIHEMYEEYNASMGYSTYSAGMTAKDLVEEADKALYKSKLRIIRDVG